MRMRIRNAAALAVAVTLLSTGVAAAHDDTSADDGAIDNAKATHGHDQHGGDEGHLPPTTEDQQGDLEVVSRLGLRNVSEGKIADVGVLGDTAYLAAWGGVTCKYNGVHVVDISDVTAPEEIGFIQSKEGSYPGEGVQALPISTASFTGDILVTNNEQCKPGVGFGGMNIYDVTNPAAPTKLAVGFGDESVPGNGKKAAHEIHSVFAWDAGDRAYAVMVDNEEVLDVDIVDITNPRKPVLIAEYDLAEEFPQILQPGQGLDEVFLHDMVVKQIGDRFVMLASYWDAGYVQLDVTDPLAPIYLSDSDFTNPDPEAAESGLTVPPEGNGHQAEFAGEDDAFVLGADEDFSPFALEAINVEDGTEIDAGQGSDTTPLEPGDTITAQSVFFGRGCNGDPNAGAAEGTQIAVVERGLCTFTEKVANVTAAGGYEAVLIFNRTGPDGCNASLGMSVEGDIPTFGVAPREQGFDIFDATYDDAACLAGTGSELSGIPVGDTGDTLSFSSYFDGWGYVHLFDSATMTDLDTYAIPEAHDESFATGFGDLSVHEVATSGRNSELAYLSYYSGGLRVIDAAGGEIQEQAAFIDDGGNNFWGVQVFESGGKEYVAASDRDFGLYIFEYSPVNATP
ncbi:MAG: PA domain-containing protein [Acidimicrobiales bacterium]